MQPHLGLFLTCLYKNQMARKEKEPFPENEEEDERGHRRRGFRRDDGE